MCVAIGGFELLTIDEGDNKKNIVFKIIGGIMIVAVGALFKKYMGI